jgi:hypothetical protein
MIIHSIIALEDILNPPPYDIETQNRQADCKTHPVDYGAIRQNAERALPVTDPRIALKCCEYFSSNNKK